LPYSDLTQIKTQIVQITRKVLDGRVGGLQGCLLLAPLCNHFNTNENQELITFLVVADELQKPGLSNRMQGSRSDIALDAFAKEYDYHILEACKIAYDKFVTYEQRAQYHLVDLCKQLLSGDIDFWDACCRISGGTLALEELGQDNPLFSVFQTIDSEIEDCPRNSLWRSRCDAGYLEKKDRELESYRKAIEQDVYKDCREIIRQYDD
jgi:hypothetical protein